MRVLILDAGGHGKVVADILLVQSIRVLVFWDDDPTTWNTQHLGLPVMGEIDRCREFKFGKLIIESGRGKTFGFSRGMKALALAFRCR
jgi:hypothetical protein